MRIPTKEECFELLKEYKVPQNIIEHSIQVNKIAVFLANKLKEKCVDINTELVDSASLLHDLDKMDSIRRKDPLGHGYYTEKILNQKGFPEVGYVVAVHIAERLSENKVKSWEQKIVNYADKRVTHDKIVGVDERFDDVIKRYNHLSKENFEELRKLSKDLEKEIFSHLDFKPEDLKEEMEKEN